MNGVRSCHSYACAQAAISSIGTPVSVVKPPEVTSVIDDSAALRRRSVRRSMAMMAPVSIGSLITQQEIEAMDFDTTVPLSSQQELDIMRTRRARLSSAAMMPTTMQVFSLVGEKGTGAVQADGYVPVEQRSFKQQLRAPEFTYFFVFTLVHQVRARI